MLSYEDGPNASPAIEIWKEWRDAHKAECESRFDALPEEEKRLTTVQGKKALKVEPVEEDAPTTEAESSAEELYPYYMVDGNGSAY